MRKPAPANNRRKPVICNRSRGAPNDPRQRGKKDSLRKAGRKDSERTEMSQNSVETWGTSSRDLKRALDDASYPMKWWLKRGILKQTLTSRSSVHAACRALQRPYVHNLMSHSVQPAQSVSTTKDMKQRTQEGRNVKALSETVSLFPLSVSSVHSESTYTKLAMPLCGNNLFQDSPNVWSCKRRKKGRVKRECVCVCVWCWREGWGVWGGGRDVL